MVFTQICIYKYIHIDMFYKEIDVYIIFIYINVYIYMYIHIHMYKYVYIYIYTCTVSHTCIYIHMYIMYTEASLLWLTNINLWLGVHHLESENQEDCGS